MRDLIQRLRSWQWAGTYQGFVWVAIPLPGARQLLVELGGSGFDRHEDLAMGRASRFGIHVVDSI